MQRALVEMGKCAGTLLTVLLSMQGADLHSMAQQSATPHSSKEEKMSLRTLVHTRAVVHC